MLAVKLDCSLPAHCELYPYSTQATNRHVFIFFLFRGNREVSLFFFSNCDELRVIPDSDTTSLRIFGEIGSIRLESRKNSLRLENNIRTCCTKVKESITNQLRICGMQHELTEIRGDSTRFARFSLTIAIKKRPVHASGHQFQNQCSS